MLAAPWQLQLFVKSRKKKLKAEALAAAVALSLNPWPNKKLRVKGEAMWQQAKCKKFQSITVTITLSAGAKFPEVRQEVRKIY